MSDEDFQRIPAPIPPPSTNLLEDLMSAAADRISASDEAKNMNELDVEDCIKLSNQLYRGTKFTSIAARASVFINLCNICKIQLDGTQTRGAMFDLLSSLVSRSFLSMSLTNFTIRLKWKHLLYPLKHL